MIRRVLFTTAVLQSLLCTAAMACDGQAGKVIYEDTFADDSGGWAIAPPAMTIKPPNFIFALSSKNSNASSQVLTFHATDADYCAEVTLPKSFAPDNKYALGLEFWAVDFDNCWIALLFSDGSVSLYTRTNGNWTNVLTTPSAPGFKTEPDAVNSLRVTTIGGKISIYLNGQLVKAIRAQVPDGSLHFGMYGQMDKGDDSAAPILVKSFKVTSGQ